MTLATFLIALGAALGLGLLIGLERQFGQHPAGLRTNALVCAGAALYVLLARSLVQGVDAGKVAGQIVSGIGFLGGGVILREGLTIRGLTTAATLWCSAAVGALCGADLPQLAGIATSAIVGTNCLLNPVSRWIDRKAAKRAYIDTSYRIKVVCAMSEERRIRRMLAEQVAAQRDMTLHGIGIHSTDRADRGLVVADVEMRVRDEHVLQDIVALLNADPSTSSTSWERHS
ncbi:MAG: MgtC/SapB family protein [Thermoguttaceae bacterium]|jgi:putative Mg2+ transporter-C (MgtC) family protein